MNPLIRVLQLISTNVRPIALNKVHKSLLHVNSALLGYEKHSGPMRFTYHNKKIYPPQRPEDEPRPAVRIANYLIVSILNISPTYFFLIFFQFVCHVKTNFKYSPDKMWYVAVFVRGMTVDEAVRQLSFVHLKGTDLAKEAILEAQELAVQKHNVEFKSNLWIGKFEEIAVNQSYANMVFLYS